MDFNNIIKCKKCFLRENQLPLLDNKKSADVFWVGLSAVKVENIHNDIPLCKKTNSGKLIGAIEDTLENVSFYKTNLVKCLPLNESKTRYPNNKEMSACYDHLLCEINAFKPKVVFLLGKIVSDFIAKREKIVFGPLNPNFEYMKFNIINTTIVPIHHPSYIQIYKRKKVDNFMAAVKNICEA